MGEHVEVMSQLKIIEAQNHKILKSINHTDPNEVLTINMVSKQYHVSKKTIHNHMNKGLLRFHKIGSSTKFYRNDVDEWMKK